MNIVYLISRAISSDGPVNQALNILTGLNQIDGVKAILVTLSPEIENGSWLYRFEERGIEVYQLNKPSWNIWGCISLLKSYIIEHKIDVVHSSGYRADIVNMYLNKYVTTVSTQRSNPRELAEEFPKILRFVINKYHIHVIKKIQAQVACSFSLQSIFSKEENMDIECVQNAVNTDFFIPVNSAEKKMLRKELNLPLYKTIYLVLGVLLPRKNNKVIINAYIDAKLSDSLLVFVGGGIEEPLLKELSKDNSNIVFAGITKNPVKYLQAADILVSSSLAEGLPNTVLEAISCGLPVILSDIEPHKELICESDAGIIFNRNSVKELTDCLVDSLRWNIEYKSKCARSIAEKKYSISVLANNYLKLYQKYFKKA